MASTGMLTLNKRAHRPGSSSSVARRLLRNPLVIAGAVVVVGIVSIAIIGPLMAPHSPTELVGRPYSPPTGAFPLGTDHLGHDVLSRVLHGGKDLIWMSVLAALLGVLVGTVIGITAALAPRAVDEILMRAIDVLLAFPSMLLVLLFVSMLGPSPTLLVFLVAVTHVPAVARVTRGASLPIREMEFITWARLAGANPVSMVFREVLPNITSPLLVELGLRMMWSVSLLAALSFLGYGIQPPAADWGLMINENRGALISQPAAIATPILLIATFTAGLSLIVEGASRVISRTERIG